MYDLVGQATHKLLRPVLTGAIVGGAVLGPVVFATSASAATVTATCAETSSATYNSALDPNSTDTPQDVDSNGTGTVLCVDPTGNPLGQAKVAYDVDIPNAVCDGTASDNGGTETITWPDNTQTKISFQPTTYTAVKGQVTYTSTGTVTSDSTKYAGAGVTETGTITASGCGTASGASSDSDLAVTTFAG